MAGARPLQPVVAALDGLLRVEGFHRSRTRWRNLAQPAVVRELVLEPFRFNTAGLHRFRLVVSLYVATGDVGEFAFPPLAGRYSLALQTDDATLAGDPGTFREMPGDGTDPAFLADLQRHVGATVLPVLRQATTIESVEAVTAALEARAGRAIHAVTMAIALARSGRQEAARTQFRRAIGDPAAIRAVAARHGIDLDA